MKTVRTCTGCNGKDLRENLLRVVAHENLLVIDGDKTKPGRGAWLHATVTCLEKAIDRRAFGRALRVSSHLDPIHLREQADRLMDK